MAKEKIICIICGEEQDTLFHYQDHDYYRCPKCEQVSTYPLPTTKMMEDHYRKKFNEGNYKLLRDYAPQYLKVYRQLLGFVRKRVEKAHRTFKGMTALDVGAFTGDFTQLLLKEGVDGYGLELQDEAVEIAEKTMPGRIFRSDVMSDKFPQKEYDLVSLLGIIEHVTDPRKLIKRSAELMKPGGFLIIQTPNSGTIPAKAMSRFWPPYAPIEHIHLFSPDSIRLLLQQEGFENISVKAHVKPLPLGYVYNQLKNFGPEFYKMTKPIGSIIEKAPKDFSLPFYIGEMVVLAEKKS